MTEPGDLTRTRIAYDRVAVAYAEISHGELSSNPHDRAVLALFAELAGPGPVLEVGCGPGRVTGHLAGLGLEMSGLDLSPGMIGEARRRFPELTFTVGSMDALDRPDGELAGLVGWYSIIHTPPERRPDQFAEFARVLRPGGWLALAFQVGDGPRHLDRAYGHEIDLDAYRLDPDRIAGLLADAGLAVQTQIVRRPRGSEKTDQAYLLATRTAPQPDGHDGGR